MNIPHSTLGEKIFAAITCLAFLAGGFIIVAGLIFFTWFCYYAGFVM